MRALKPETKMSVTSDSAVGMTCGAVCINKASIKASPGGEAVAEGD